MTGTQMIFTYARIFAQHGFAFFYEDTQLLQIASMIIDLCSITTY